MRCVSHERLLVAVGSRAGRLTAQCAVGEYDPRQLDSRTAAHMLAAQGMPTSLLVLSHQDCGLSCQYFSVVRVFLSHCVEWCCPCAASTATNTAVYRRRHYVNDWPLLLNTMHRLRIANGNTATYCWSCYQGAMQKFIYCGASYPCK